MYNIAPLEDFPETIYEEEAEEEQKEVASARDMSAPSDSKTTCRIKLLHAELPPDLQPESSTSLRCAVNVKQRVEINGLF